MGMRIRSTFTISILGLMFFTLFYIIGLYMDWQWYIVVFLSIGGILLQYLISPFIIQWVFAIDWLSYEELAVNYPHLSNFVLEISQKYKINTPRFGIIHDGNPNAFCFGWTKNSARLIITDGILQLLDREEQKAVVAHEMGHIVHNDFVVMTLVSAIPVVFYTIFNILIRIRVGSSGRDSGKAEIIKYAIAILAYVFYIIGYLLSLLISRIREYYADEFSAQETKNPNALSTALVKIAYGLLPKKDPTNGSNVSKTSVQVLSVKSLGIFDPSSAAGFIASSMSESNKIENERIVKAAAWDLHNPWAKYFELFSTHPLPAKRIKELSYYGYSTLKVTPTIDLTQTEKVVKEQVGGSLWGHFFVDVIIQILPKLVFFGALILGFVYLGLAFFAERNVPFLIILIIGSAFLLSGFAQLVQNSMKYNTKFIPQTVDDLIGNVKVSPIRPQPAIIDGTIIGRGVPGLFYSEDLMLKDDHGIVLIDYNFGIGLVNFLFGILKTGKLIGHRIRVYGWFRRGPGPRIQIKRIEDLDVGNSYRNFLDVFYQILAFLLIFIGAVILLFGLGYI